MWVSRIGVIVWALFMGVIMSVAQFANINVNWLVLIIGRSSLLICASLVEPCSCVWRMLEAAATLQVWPAVALSGRWSSLSSGTAARARPPSAVRQLG